MTILKIVKWPDPILRNACEPIEKINSKIEKLAANMAETMYAAPGVGLAANQVGEPIQLVVIDITAPDAEKDLLVLINPEITEIEGEEVLEEGCLSIPGFRTPVTRASRVVVDFTDLEGNEMQIEAEGLMARALQHEIDHINGKMFPDRVSRLKRNILFRKVRKSIEDGSFGK